MGQRISRFLDLLQDNSHGPGPEPVFFLSKALVAVSRTRNVCFFCFHFISARWLKNRDEARNVFKKDDAGPQFPNKPFNLREEVAVIR